MVKNKLSLFTVKVMVLILNFNTIYSVGDAENFHEVMLTPNGSIKMIHAVDTIALKYSHVQNTTKWTDIMRKKSNDFKSRYTTAREHAFWRWSLWQSCTVLVLLYIPHTPPFQLITVGATESLRLSGAVLRYRD